MPFGGEFWAFPKRVAIREMQGMLLSYTEVAKGKRPTWENYLQELVARKMRDKNRSPILLSTKSVRVTKDEAQYLGFCYISNGKFVITEAGKRFVSAKDPADVLRGQLLKLQLTNPAESTYTRGISVFPFRVVLTLLLKLGHLTREELGLFVFRMKNESDISKVEDDIREFRTLPQKSKRSIVGEFEKTDVGRKLLVKAPYVGYALAFLKATGWCRLDPYGRLILKAGATPAVRKFLLDHKGIKPTIFQSLEEWFEYMGNPDRLDPPQDVQIIAETKIGLAPDVFVEITSGDLRRTGFTNNKGEFSTSLYIDQKYETVLHSPENYSKASLRVSGVEYANTLRFTIPTSVATTETLDHLIEAVRELTSKRLDHDLQDKLDILRMKTGRSPELKPLRGSRLEQLIYKMLQLLSANGLFATVVWNGKEGQYGLPQHSGPGEPDIVASTDNSLFVIECTLLKGRSQWKQPEGASVPDHLAEVNRQNPSKRVVGLFIASVLDAQTVRNLIDTGKREGFPIVPIEIADFLNVIKSLENGNARQWISMFDQLWKMRLSVHGEKKAG